MGFKRKIFAGKNEDIVIVYAIMAFVFIIGTLLEPRFLSGRNLGNIMEQAAALGIAAIGQMMVILLAGIDLSVGAVISMTTTILSLNIVSGYGGTVLNIVIALIAGSLAGCINGFGVVKYRIPPFIMTLSTMLIINGVALKIRPIPGGSVEFGFMELLNGRFLIFPHIVLVWLVLIFGTWYVLKKRRFGRNLFAAGGNYHAAELSGINVRRVTFSAHVLAALFATLAGIYVSARMGTGDANLGSNFGMDSITVCVLGGVNLFGGRGNIAGLVAATFILSGISNILNLNGVDSFYQYVFKGLILLITVLVFSLKPGRKKESGGV